MTTIRLARADDLGWVNDTYKQISFLPSKLSNEHIAIAEINHEKAGLGRLVALDGKCAELGGMYILEKFRNRGLARLIVDYLLSQGPQYTTIYCLPFKHLQTFYMSFGFLPCEHDKSVPEEIRHKHTWCNETYPHEVLLLKLTR